MTATGRESLDSDGTTALAKEVAEDAPEGAPEPGDRHDDQVQAARQGVPRLVAELRLEDDHLALLAARP